jgi:endonuclease/exonuclease/phosphatase family metal-dependent hydrolase
MASPTRIATFNVENLFTRAKALNFANNATGDAVLADVERLRRELRKAAYDGPKIVALYGTLRDYIDVAEIRGKLFNRAKTQVVARGVRDWGGFIAFKREKFSEDARKNTARVLRAVNADILCLIEVESRPVLRHFCIDRLPRTGAFRDYRHLMVIDGNDTRGIDVALASRHPIRGLWSHVDDSADGGRTRIFSRDCLEVEVVPDGDGAPIYLLLNHLKSKGYGAQATNDARRRAQAALVAEILAGYNLRRDRVVVCGDLNDTPGSAPLRPLLRTPDLHDVFDVAGVDPADRWTYHYRRNEQIDYLLVSKPLRDRLAGAGVERRGMADVARHSGGAITPFDTVTGSHNAASDHAAVWADFAL